MNPEELRNLIECYRPSRDGSGDAEFAALQRLAAEDPAVREQMEAVQQWDEAIGRAMRDVPVPEGLESRLLTAVDDPTVQAHESRRRWWNRWPVRVTAAAVAIAAVIMLMIPILGWNDSLTSDEVAAQVRDWITTGRNQTWQRSNLPSEVMKHRKFFRLPINGWQHATVLGDEQAVVCSATVDPGRAKAWLFVIKSSKGRLLPSRPPQTPDSTTGNIYIGVWKDGNHIFVLAVNSRDAYKRLLRSVNYA